MVSKFSHGFAIFHITYFVPRLASTLGYSQQSLKNMVSKQQAKVETRDTNKKPVCNKIKLFVWVGWTSWLTGHHISGRKSVLSRLDLEISRKFGWLCCQTKPGLKWFPLPSRLTAPCISVLQGWGKGWVMVWKFNNVSGQKNIFTL